jgi:hypothetical protein
MLIAIFSECKAISMLVSKAKHQRKIWSGPSQELEVMFYYLSFYSSACCLGFHLRPSFGRVPISPSFLVERLPPAPDYSHRMLTYSQDNINAYAKLILLSKKLPSYRGNFVVSTLEVRLSSIVVCLSHLHPCSA